MLRFRLRRSSRSRLFRAIVVVFIIASLVDLFSLVRARRRNNQVRDIKPSSTERIFVASIHWNNEAILRSHWNGAVLRLVEHLGAKHVYVSILESGSWDDSKGALKSLDGELKRLGVERTIVLEKTTHADEIAQTPGGTGWIDTARGQQELRRIPYLSRLRNRSLEPLAKLAEKGIKFDRVLFLNDVVFDIQDVITLLSTRGGDYAAACSLDFSKPPHYYDTFALRDSDGDEAVTTTYPYFRSSASRNALISGQPVPVQSCWNGIVAFDAAPFYHMPPLRFRGIPDSLARYHLEASECCLVHADNPLSSKSGVWLNPHVRVGYNAEAYDSVHQSTPWPSIAESIVGLWKNRFWRWITPTFHKKLKVTGRVREWTRKGLGEVAQRELICFINEMQVLVANGWAHV
ncbi:MAG: hypothetical protein L6R39_001999 [Caloplaca ligustica]|nr:MAG: hypothetical protein L6R39_001999 [Caloplaca ligustica]